MENLASSREEAGRSGARRQVSLTTVAERAGVSIATVSRVVNGVANKASVDTIARVRAAIDELGYRPSGAGQALRRRESRIVAVIAANLANPAMSAITASTEAALREAGYVMALCDSHDSADLQDEYLREMRAQLVSAFVLLGAVESPVLDQIMAAGETVLFVNREHPHNVPASYVGIDNRIAGRDVAEQVAAWQAKHVLVIHGPISSSATRERVNMFRKRLRSLLPDAGIDVRGSMSPDHLNTGFELASCRLNDTGHAPDVIFCLSDLIAYGAARALREREIGVPETCRIIGFDDNPLNEWIAPWLSSVRVPYEDFGDAIVSCLKDAWAKGEVSRTFLQHRLIVRS
ncbi:MAG: LacI family DNA-binding transcriptional regulator [Geminicoccaceae bacterium]|nr:LacI family DNA-binding transcriptional regulator [Geminicoccaceae bacterium]